MIACELNPQRRIEVRSVGAEKTPVVLMDDVLAAPEALVDHAAREARFSHEHVQAYPGVRAPLPPEYAATLMPELRRIVSEVYRPLGERDLRIVQQLFSLVARSPQTLDLLQRMPHFDSNDPFYFATVHFLNRGDFAGTGIFRHRPTGFESISRQRYEHFVRAAKQHVQSHGEPPPAYIVGSDDHFELIETLEYRPNRLLLYPGYLLHSGLIDPGRDVSADPATGRLTANLFFMPEGAAN
ncbi:MAG: DUF6445 family protein [Halieaceae bacterium]|nr:DUF6445 family protein [Halieaceae bacterium]